MSLFDAYIMTDWSGGSRRRKNRQDAIWIAHGDIEDDSPQTESPSFGDPVAQKLVEWALLRHAEGEARFERYATFIRANPDWPSIPMLRQHAEVRLQEPRYGASVRGFLGEEPTGAEDRPGVNREIRAAQDRDER
jgi:soluble lytic murein transglycosylase